MYFSNQKEFLLFLKKFGPEIGFGSQGIVYHDKKTNLVYKVFHQFFDEYIPDEYIEYDRDEIMRFSNVKNKTFIWSNDVIYVGDKIVGTISKYVKGKNLYQTDPLLINLDSFVVAVKKAIKDIIIISDNGIFAYDMMYNILYGNGKINIVDYDDYSYSNKSRDELLKLNLDIFTYEIMLFLIDNYFDEFVLNCKNLRSMYGQRDVNIIEFITEFKKMISEYVGNDIKYLKSAKSCINKRKLEKPKYERLLVKI